MKLSKILNQLLVTTALGGALVASSTAAQAQTAAGSEGVLSEVVVTATRQADTVSKVALSVTAVTQRALDQQGVTEVKDLQRIVPSLQVNQSSGGGVASQFSIRGVSSGAGAAVTGVYLDDTSLTKRNQNGVSNLNGTPAPPLYDLERVEVLRGPQGTLYGGSAMGGAIRFITPTPSLTTKSGYVKTQTSTTAYGGQSYEGGFAVGGPIIDDKLGYRVSFMRRSNAGWIDAVNPYTASVFKKDSNSNQISVFRGALLWKASEDLKINLSAYASRENVDDSSSFTLPVASAKDIFAAGKVTQALVDKGWGGIQDRCTKFVPAANGISTSATRATATTAVLCSTPGVTYRYAANPWRAYNLDKYQSLRGGPNATSPALSETQVGSVTVDYDLHFATAKAILSQTHDVEQGVTYDTSVIAPLFSGYPYFLPSNPNWNSTPNFRPNNHRFGTTEEIRISSPADATKLTWLVGIYSSNIRARGFYQNIEDIISPTRSILGVSDVERYGAPLMNPLTPGVYAQRDQTLKDTELAAFGEFNWFVLPSVKLTAGARRSKVAFEYSQVFFGPINNSNDPKLVPGGITNGRVEETPFSPKLGAQWQITDKDQVYATWSNGYRPGGVNSPLSDGQCGAALATWGLTVSQVPTTFSSDTIESKEVGFKTRLFGNRLAINTAAYQIDWTNLQTNVGPNSLGCGQQWVANLGAARSEGLDFETQLRLFEGFTVSVNYFKNNGFYTADAVGPTPTNGAAPQKFATSGYTLGNQPYGLNLQAQYSFRLNGLWNAFVRGDYSYTPEYKVSQFGQSGWTPDGDTRNATKVVNLRAGVTFDKYDINAFVNNATNSDDGTPSGGRTGCTTQECTAFSSYNPVLNVNSFRPREIGVQGTYRF